METDILELKDLGPRVLYVNVYPLRIVGNKTEFLLFKRRSDVVLPSIWQPVSGKIKKGQSISEAFKAQVMKKTGILPVRLLDVDYVNTYYDAYYDQVMLVPAAGALLAEDANLTLDLELHDESRWLDFSELPKFIPFHGQLEVFQRLKKLVES
jgi:8-oxo-dGTP pyrophosphatase MutT (NUDIX family)